MIQTSPASGKSSLARQMTTPLPASLAGILSMQRKARIMDFVGSHTLSLMHDIEISSKYTALSLQILKTLGIYTDFKVREV